MILAVLVLLAGAFPLALAGGAHAATSPPLVLRVGTVNLAITTFNPLRITLPDESFVVYNTYSTLAAYDNAYNVVPSLASSFSVSPNGTLWTLHLVPNAYFTDPLNPTNLSHPVTSADVVFSYILQMNNPASVQHLYVQGIASAIAVDATTVQLLTLQPYAPMPTALARVPILPKYIWSTLPNPLSYNPTYPIGSGALYYDPTNSTLSAQIVLHRNPSYFGAADYGQFSQPDTVQLISYSSPALMASDFASGSTGLNAITGLDPATYLSSMLAPFPRVGVDQGFVGEYSMNVMSTAERSSLVAAGLTQFRTGTNNQLLLNPTVRDAIAMSINKSALVQNALMGLGNVADTLVPDSNPWHFSIPPANQFPFNPAAARALLNAAGWAYDSLGNPNPHGTPLYQAGGTNPLIFRFYTLNTAATWAIAANATVGWLAQAGILSTNRLGAPGFGTFSLNQMSGFWLSGDYDLWLWNWLFSPGADPSLDILSVETTTAIGALSDNFYTNHTYDALYNQSLVTLNLTQRHVLVNQMQSMIYGYASYVLPYYAFDLDAFRNDAPNPSSVAWTNWGDWNANPALAPDSNLPNLWFQVRPSTVRNHPPTTPIIQGTSPLLTPAFTPAAFVGNASDPDPNETLTWTWSWGDGQSTVITTTSAATGVSASHEWSPGAIFTVTLTVSDGSLSATSAPFTVEVYGVSLTPNLGRPGVPVRITGTIIEPSKGKWTMNFGDGNGVTGSFVPGVTVISFNHTYAATGNYTATLTAKTGFIAGIAQALQVIDGIPPALVLPFAVVVEATGNLTPVIFAVNATDNIGLAGPPACTPPSGSRFALGTTRVTCQATDLVGNTATGSFNVTVRDTTPPLVSVSAFSFAEATSAAGAIVNFSVAAFDAVGVVRGPTCTPPPGSQFPMGNTNVVCTAADAAGNVGHANTTVIVRDTTPPTIRFPRNLTAEATSAAGAVVRYNVSAFDAVGVATGPLCTPVSGSLFPIGQSFITCTAVDTSGNVATVTFLATVRDTTPPVTTLTSATDGSGFSVGSNGSTPSTSISFTFTGTDAVGVVGFLCGLDNLSLRPCASGVTFSALSPGFHTFYVAAVDAAGNRNPMVLHWTVMTPLGTVQDLINKVNTLRAAGVLTKKQADTLLAPLSRATTDLSAGHVATAIKDLKSFNATVAQDITAGILTPAAGRALENESCDLIRVLGGTC